MRDISDADLDIDLKLFLFYKYNVIISLGVSWWQRKVAKLDKKVMNSETIISETRKVFPSVKVGVELTRTQWKVGPVH